MTITIMKHQKTEDVDRKIPISEIFLLLAVLGSIVGSIFLYFITGKSEEAIFIGLWAPTIMSLINYINLKFKK